MTDRPQPPAPAAAQRPPVDLAGLAAAVRSIERGENPSAPAPRGDPAEARRKRREAMAAEIAARQAEEAPTPPGEPASADEPAPADAEGPDASEGPAPADTEHSGSPEDAAPADAEGPDASEGPALADTAATPAAEGLGDPEEASPAAEGSGDSEGGTTAATNDPAGSEGGTTQGRGEPRDQPQRTATHAPTAPVAAHQGPPAESPTAGRAQSAPGDPDESTPQGRGEPRDQPQRTATQPHTASVTPEQGPPAARGEGAAAAGRTGERPTAQNPAGATRRAPVDPEAVSAARAVLAGGGAPEDLAEELVRLAGERAAQALREDPWLILGLPAVRVEQGDAFARALLGAEAAPGDDRRARALVARALEDAAARGHTAVRSADLNTALSAYALPDPASAVSAAVADGQVLVFRDGSAPQSAQEDDEEDADVPLLLALDRYALAEESLADGFVRLLRSFEGTDAGDGWASGAAAPTPSAAELIKAVAGSGLVVHSGGESARAEPAALVAAARAGGLRAYAAAYTAGGRQRLAAAVGEEAAVTVTGLLSGAEGPGRAPDGSLALDVLAVLDAPQLSVEEATTLVESVPDGARLVLSGDPHTLWSAGPGRVFADLLAAKVCPRVVSRTPDPGPIGELVSCVGEGELTAVSAPDKEVVVVPVRDAREAVHRTVQLVADSVPRAFGVDGAGIQVITPGHGGAVGTRALNAALKERLNPGPGRFAGFDPGDRVVHVPVPGRTLPGTVVGADPEGLRLECEQGAVVVPREEVAATVRHGWAVTGHQAAGMRWPAAVVVVPGDAGPLLNRSWVYTAFGRAERHLSVVQGAEQRLSQAVAGPPAAERTTRLVSVLRELTADA